MEFRYFKVVFTKEGKLVCKIDGQISAASAESLFRHVVEKKELHQKVKLPIHRLSDVPAFSYGQGGNSRGNFYSF